MTSKELHNYEDIISLPHHVSPVHPQMAVADRAAQFSPFAALTGYEDAIKETGRLTKERVELEEDAKTVLDEKLRLLRDRLVEKRDIEVAVTYFKPDGQKEGGAYFTAAGRVRKVDVYEGVIKMEDGARISFGEIMAIEGELFSDFEYYG